MRVPGELRLAEELMPIRPRNEDHDPPAERWLIAEYCSHAIYTGWHLYLRDSCEPRTRNADGGWGWIRRSSFNCGSAHSALASLGITMREGSDGTCDDDGYAELARRYQFGRQQTGGRPRGGVRVLVGHPGLALAKPPAEPRSVEVYGR